MPYNAKNFTMPIPRVGQRFGKTTVTDIHEKSYTLRCDCGKPMNRKFTAASRPEMCSACAKLRFTEGHQPESKAVANGGLQYREYSVIEELMMKEFRKKKLTKTEQYLLTQHRKKAIA